MRKDKYTSVSEYRQRESPQVQEYWKARAPEKNGWQMLGVEIAAVGERAAKMALRLREDEDQAEMSDMQSRYIEWANQQKDSILQTKGKDSFGVVDKFQEGHDDFVEGELQGKNQRVAGRMLAWYRERGSAYKSVVGGHERGERLRFGLESEKSRQATAIDEAVANFGNDAVRERALADYALSVQRAGELQGWDGEIVARATKEGLSAGFVAAADKMVAESPDAAGMAVRMLREGKRRGVVTESDYAKAVKSYRPMLDSLEVRSIGERILSEALKGATRDPDGKSNVDYAGRLYEWLGKKGGMGHRLVSQVSAYVTSKGKVCEDALNARQRKVETEFRERNVGKSYAEAMQDPDWHRLCENTRRSIAIGADAYRSRSLAFDMLMGKAPLTEEFLYGARNILTPEDYKRVEGALIAHGKGVMSGDGKRASMPSKEVINDAFLAMIGGKEMYDRYAASPEGRMFLAEARNGIQTAFSDYVQANGTIREEKTVAKVAFQWWESHKSSLNVSRDPNAWFFKGGETYATTYGILAGTTPKGDPSNGRVIAKSVWDGRYRSDGSRGVSPYVDEARKFLRGLQVEAEAAVSNDGGILKGANGRGVAALLQADVYDDAQLGELLDMYYRDNGAFDFGGRKYGPALRLVIDSGGGKRPPKEKDGKAEEPPEEMEYSVDQDQ